MMLSLGLLWLRLQLLVALGALLGRLASLRATPADAVRVHRTLTIAALGGAALPLVLPVSAALGPRPTIWAAAEPGSSLAGPVVAFGDRVLALDAVQSGGMGALALVGAALVLGAVALVRTGLAAWRAVQGTSPVRRLGRVQIRVSDADGPLALRMPGRAVVVLPASILHDPTATWLAVRHELTHLRHGDASWAWVLGVLRVLAPHPLTRLWCRWQRDSEELRCDAAVTANTAVDVPTYAQLLLDVARTSTAPLAMGRAMAHPSLLTQRITMLLNPSTRRSPRLLLPAVLAAVLGMGGLAVAADAGVVDARVPQASIDTLAAELAPSGLVFPSAPHTGLSQALDTYAGTERGRRTMRVALDRSLPHQPGIAAAADRHGVPRAVAAIPLLESRYENLDAWAYPTPQAELEHGWKGAGLWMFIPTTARAYGMHVGPERDDRLDVAIETDAAMRLLVDLHESFGTWELAFAGYNQGPDAVRKAIAAGGTTDAWALSEAGLLNDYVPQLGAMMLIWQDPALVGR